MTSSRTYGYLNDYATVFTMDNRVNQGWLWQDDTDGANAGAASLTTDGRFYVDQLVDTPKVVLRSGGEIQSDGTIMRFTF